MEIIKNTKEKILRESLRLFSHRGYDGVSMREIAAAVGIQGASLYNHFKGKEDIFTALFHSMKQRYEEASSRLRVPAKPDAEGAEVYCGIQEGELLTMAEGLFSFFARDEVAVLFRKLMVGEQHKSNLAAHCYQSYYLEAPIQFQKQLFEGLQQKGVFAGYDAETMALHFFSPIFFLLTQYDLGGGYEECLEKLKRHIHWFCILYRKEGATWRDIRNKS